MFRQRNQQIQNQEIDGAVEEKKEKKNVEKRKLLTVSVFQLFRYTSRTDMIWLVLGLICSVINGASMMGYTILLGHIFDSLTSVEGFNVNYCFYMLGIGGAVICLACGQVTFLTVTADRTIARVRVAYLKSLLKQDIAYFDQNMTGKLSTSIVENSIVLRDAIGDKVGLVIQNLSLFVAGVIVGFTYLWDLTLVTLCLTPLLIVAAGFMAKTLRSRSSKQLQAYADAGGVAEETLVNMRTIAALNAQEHRIGMYSKYLQTASDMIVKSGFMGGLGSGMTMGIFFISYGVAFYVGGVFIVQSRNSAQNAYPLSEIGNSTICGVNLQVPPQCTTGLVNKNSVFLTNSDVCSCELCGCGCYANPVYFGAGAAYDCVTGGTVLLVFMSMLLGAFGLGQSAAAINAIANARVAARTIYDTINARPTIQTIGTGVVLPEVRGAIVFSNVAFTYPTREQPIFRNLNLSMPAGQKIAIVGGSGSGKSTIIQLILRFYDPLSGVVTIDGVDLKMLDLKWFRSQIGLISQEPILFATSIRENIRFGKPGATDEEIEQACRQANCYDFITKFPEGFSTFVGAGGSQMSGGQKQRMCLARSFIRKPSLLLCDEATSALDMASEQIVNASIDSFSAAHGHKCTTIVIAHRLETIRKCDVIFVLESGVLVEKGSHEELVALEGQYAALVKIADRKTEENDDDIKASILVDPSQKVASPQIKPKTSLSQVENTDDAEEEEEEEEERVDQEENEDPSVDHNDAFMENSQFQNATAPLKGSFVIPKEGALSKLVEPLMPESDTTTTSKKKKKKQKKERIALKRIFGFAYPDRFVFIPALTAASVVGLMFPLFALVFSQILNTFYDVVNQDLLTQCRTWALAFFGLGCAQFLASVIQGTSFGYINGRMTVRVREQTFKSLLRSEIGFFDEPVNSVGTLTAKLASDASLVKAAISDQAGLVVQSTATIISGLSIAFSSSWEVSLVVFGLFPIMFMGSYWRNKALHGVLSANNTKLAEANQTVSEAIAGIRTVVAFNLMDSIVDVYTKQLDKARQGMITKGFTAGLTYGYSQSTRFFVNALALWFGSTLIAKNQITFQNLIQAMFGILMSAIATGSALSAAPDIANARPACVSIFKVIDRKSLIDWSVDVGEKPSEVIGDISFENVTFTYPTRPGTFALNGFNLNIRRGQTVALVGPSGSGKSTVVALLERFYDPDQGIVRLDSRDVKSLNIRWLRNQMGLVSQEPVLMNESIIENVRYGQFDATDEECIQACKDSNAHDFISSLPEGYQTMCGNKGGQLSGGQKQRIAIARALVKKPKILLLDESTSALDEESQKVVQDALDRLLKLQARTTIIIAHRFSTIKDADVIAVVAEGRVVEQGTFNELAAMNGTFAGLLRSQKH